MKIKNKPDLMFVLALFVGAGVLWSTYGQGIFPESGESTEFVSASATSRTAHSLYLGNFIQVSTKNASKDSANKDNGKSAGLIATQP